MCKNHLSHSRHKLFLFRKLYNLDRFSHNRMVHLLSHLKARSKHYSIIFITEFMATAAEHRKNIALEKETFLKGFR